MSTIYASPEARERLRAWFPRFLARISAPTEARTVQTRFGETHLLVGGPEDGPPLVLLHGALASSAHALYEAAPLLGRLRVYALDVPGHSPMSADVRLPLDGYGPWLVDALDALGLVRPALCGVSYGGFVAIRGLATAPDRFARATLVVPGGLVRGSMWDGIVRLALPMAVYRWFPSEARLHAFFSSQLTTVDPLWMGWLGDAIRLFRLDFRTPPLATEAELAAWRGPVQVFGADDDIHFPGPALLARAHTVFANAASIDAELLENCKHSPPFEDAFRERLCARVGAFVEARV
jgi:pimeloyl-ACP methyl ester carboxylesterase